MLSPIRFLVVRGRSIKKEAMIQLQMKEDGCMSSGARVLMAPELGPGGVEDILAARLIQLLAQSPESAKPRKRNGKAKYRADLLDQEHESTKKTVCYHLPTKNKKGNSQRMESSNYLTDHKVWRLLAQRNISHTRVGEEESEVVNAIKGRDGKTDEADTMERSVCKHT